MAKRTIIISERDNIATLFEGDKAIEFIIHRGDMLLGDVYLAEVENILPSIDAAFVNVGGDKMGFLHSSDVQGKGDLKTRLSPKQKLIVQIMKEPTGHKGPRVTTNLSLPGRFLVLIPDSKGISISRKIESPSERARLKAIMNLQKPSGVGVIIRTEAQSQCDADIQEDFDVLLERWQNIVSMADSTKSPSLLYRDQDLLYRVIREMVTEEVDELVVDTPFGFQRAQQLLQNWNLDKRLKVTQYTGSQSIMQAKGVEREIRQALQTKVPLPSGGYLYLQQTEALTVIDVNSGKFTSLQSQADTIRITNLEASREIARQLRLRNIGGMVVVDFIDMEARADQLAVLQGFELDLMPDKAKPQVGQLTDLGLVEMTRHRQGQSLREIFAKNCPTCSGVGHVADDIQWASTSIEFDSKTAGDFRHGGARGKSASLRQRFNRESSSSSSSSGGRPTEGRPAEGRNTEVRNGESRHSESKGAEPRAGLASGTKPYEVSTAPEREERSTGGRFGRETSQRNDGRSGGQQHTAGKREEREPREPRESREGREVREPREPREPREGRERGSYGIKAPEPLRLVLEKAKPEPASLHTKLSVFESHSFTPEPRYGDGIHLDELFKATLLLRFGLQFANSCKVARTPQMANSILGRMNSKSNDVFTLVVSLESADGDDYSNYESDEGDEADGDDNGIASEAEPPLNPSETQENEDTAELLSSMMQVLASRQATLAPEATPAVERPFFHLPFPNEVFEPEGFELLSDDEEETPKTEQAQTELVSFSTESLSVPDGVVSVAEVSPALEVSVVETESLETVAADANEETVSPEEPAQPEATPVVDEETLAVEAPPVKKATPAVKKPAVPKPVVVKEEPPKPPKPVRRKRSQAPVKG
jgi:ribonuclease E